MRNAAPHIAVVAATLLFGSMERVGATMVARLPLKRMAEKADRIVYATVVDVQVGRDASGVPATWVTLEVARTLKGRATIRLAIKQYGTSTPLADGTVTRVSGLPRYTVGEEIVLFLRPDSTLGFTSPVGFTQGAYRVRQRGGRRRVRREDADGEGRDLDDFLSEIEQVAGGGE